MIIGKRWGKLELNQSKKLWSFYPPALRTPTEFEWQEEYIFKSLADFKFQSCGTGHQDPVTMGDHSGGDGDLRNIKGEQKCIPSDVWNAQV